MRRIVLAAVAGMAATAALPALSQPSWERLPSWQAPPERVGSALAVPAQRPLVFASLTEVYRFIVQTRALGTTGDDALVGAVEASSTSEQVPGAAGDTLTVVKADLLTDDGGSRLRSASGNYPYYVLRRDRQGLVLLGVMFGDGYRTGVRDGRLEFTVNLHAGANVRPMRFRVDGDALVNLSPSAPARFPYLAIT